MAQNKYKYEAEYTSSNTVYKKAIKAYRGRAGEINCSLCPYNGGENSTHHIQRSWKSHRKNQWKVV